jgi:hypothetical protein
MQVKANWPCLLLPQMMDGIAYLAIPALVIGACWHGETTHPRHKYNGPIQNHLGFGELKCVRVCDVIVLRSNLRVLVG